MSESEAEAPREVANEYDVSADEIKRISDRVQRSLISYDRLAYQVRS